MQHRFHHCSRPGCHICEATPPKQHCTVCGGQDGSLPNECPGVRLSYEELEAVYHGRADFVGGKWTATKEAAA